MPKKGIKFKNNEVVQPSNRTEQTLTDKDRIIKDLQEKITDLEKQNNNLDYLLNSGRNKHEQQRIERLKDWEEIIVI
jgi:cell shape-determining protein MreC